MPECNLLAVAQARKDAISAYGICRYAKPIVRPGKGRHFLIMRLRFKVMLLSLTDAAGALPSVEWSVGLFGRGGSETVG